MKDKMAKISQSRSATNKKRESVVGARCGRPIITFWDNRHGKGVYVIAASEPQSIEAKC